MLRQRRRIVAALIHCETSKTVRFAYLNGIISVEEHVSGANAAVDAAHGHVKAKGKEVAVVEMAHTVI